MLRISKLTDYATIILGYLATYPGQIASAATIAKNVHLAAPTVSKILKILSVSHLVTSFRGSNGGYQLARPANDITLADVVLALEKGIALTECCEPHSQCSLDAMCGVKENWQLINKIIIQSLASFTLASLIKTVKPHQSLQAIPVVIQ